MLILTILHILIFSLHCTLYVVVVCVILGSPEKLYYNIISLPTSVTGAHDLGVPDVMAMHVALKSGSSK